MASTNTFAPILFHLGPLPIGETVVTTWALLLMIFVISWFPPAGSSSSLDRGRWRWKESWVRSKMPSKR